MSNKKQVTLHHIAQELKLSVHTVSKALRGLPGMSEHTRKEVMLCAQKLGYRSKEQERFYAVEQIPIYTQKQRVFKLLVNRDPQQSHQYQLILQGLQDKLQPFGHSVQTIIVPQFEREAFIDQWLMEQRAELWDGLFIAPLILPEVERRLLQLPVPRVLINFATPSQPVDSVIWDVRAAVWDSVQYLLSMNHSNILYIGNLNRHRGFAVRWHAFQEVMEKAGIGANPEQHVTEHGIDKAEWMKEVTEKIRARKPTAILSAVHCDIAWIYYACSMAGLRIPEDCSLISIQSGRNEMLPGLTRPVLPVERTGSRAAEKMLWRIANPNEPYEHTFVKGEFHFGNTVMRSTSSRHIPGLS
ncbi:LacI family DNA-binding transcriptional regulator [Paenibacillus sp. HB172176]|uniref:LacI family DNA-binding transcriptional regulator n=1 Tax=Paenibacillus sp. HB172176 TaxID=2493690 RepID=UPI00143B4610|nr:LacI family DNA-binding transcriptional regulator [Paenibacillus sp. HB172176]